MAVKDEEESGGKIADSVPRAGSVRSPRIEKESSAVMGNQI